MKTVKRRRKEQKTNYSKRFKLLSSGKPRLVFRKTNSYIIGQYVKSYEAQDKVTVGVNSKDLIEKGWPENAKGSLKSIPASYLTGYLLGKKIVKQELETPVYDIGLFQALHKTKVFAFLKGIIDAGAGINCKEEAFPEEERIKGESLKNNIEFEKIKSNIDKE